MKITTVGLDIVKSIFHSFAINHTGRLVRKEQLKRKQLLACFVKLEPRIIVMEACGGANYWARGRSPSQIKSTAICKAFC